MTPIESVCSQTKGHFNIWLKRRHYLWQDYYNFSNTDNLFFMSYAVKSPKTYCIKSVVNRYPIRFYYWQKTGPFIAVFCQIYVSWLIYGVNCHISCLKKVKTCNVERKTDCQTFLIYEFANTYVIVPKLKDLLFILQC